jgi:uncharacterized protein
MEKIMRIAAVFSILLITSWAHAASFDCAKAQSPSEKLICSNADLSSMDSQLAETYRAAKVQLSSEDQSTLVKMQRQWMQLRDQSCWKQGVDSASCLTSFYKLRIQQLQGMVPGERAQADASKTANTEQPPVSVPLSPVSADVAKNEAPPPPQATESSSAVSTPKEEAPAASQGNMANTTSNSDDSSKANTNTVKANKQSAADTEHDEERSGSGLFTLIMISIAGVCIYLIVKPDYIINKIKKQIEALPIEAQAADKILSESEKEKLFKRIDQKRESLEKKLNKPRRKPVMVLTLSVFVLFVQLISSVNDDPSEYYKNNKNNIPKYWLGGDGYWVPMSDYRILCADIIREGRGFYGFTKYPNGDKGKMLVLLRPGKDDGCLDHPESFVMCKRAQESIKRDMELDANITYNGGFATVTTKTANNGGCVEVEKFKIMGKNEIKKIGRSLSGGCAELFKDYPFKATPDGDNDPNGRYRCF